MFDGIFDDDPHSSSNYQNYFSFLDFICFSCYSSNTHLYREVAFSSRLTLLLFYLSWDSCHFSFSCSEFFKKSSSIFITTFRTKIVQTLHEFQNQFIYYSKEFFKRNSNRIFTHFSSLVLPTNLGHVFQCCLQFQNVSVSLRSKNDG